MCLAVPGKIIRRDAEEAVVDLHGNQVSVSAALVPEALVGDWVLIHAGFAIQRLSCSEAEETFAILEDIREGSGFRVQGSGIRGQESEGRGQGGRT